ncbi:MW1434 family type I TA system toxin [Cupriavidus metallidurans]|uniref:Thoeris anti-defense Tad2 family protein n=1 Tax=Cupriavidus metallidurans TaxID=119219 RepID=UPI001CCD7AB8|nr:MW1434 family type I TA system toxin [Cupriavidus metallidurans]UBM12776.1 DUF2829 domain-containing protein [Cupriavidus metallidurans]
MGAKTDELTFGEALSAMKQGAMVRRKGWAEDSYLFLDNSGDARYDAQGQHAHGGVITFRYPDGHIAPWAIRDDPSLLATDWEIAG